MIGICKFSLLAKMSKKRPRIYRHIFIICILLQLITETKGFQDPLSNLNSMTLHSHEATLNLRLRRRLKNKENRNLDCRENKINKKINSSFKNWNWQNTPKFQIIPKNFALESGRQLERNFPKNTSQQNSFLNYKTFAKHKRKLNKQISFINYERASNGLAAHTMYLDEKNKRFSEVNEVARKKRSSLTDTRKSGNKDGWRILKGSKNQSKGRCRRELSCRRIKRQKKRSNFENQLSLSSANDEDERRANATSSTLPIFFSEASLVSLISESNHPSNNPDSNGKSVQLIPLQFEMIQEGSSLSRLDQNSNPKQEKQLRRSVQRSSKSTKKTGDADELPVHKRTSVQYSSLVGPSFVNTSAHARTHALAGQTARLNCIIRNLHNFTVSWIRAGDINLLTSGDVTYSSDNRFVSVNPSKGERWVLKIHHVRLSDAGKYLCQISTSPPIDTPVNLIVTEAIAEVFPANEIFLKVGSPVRLICTIHGCPYPALPAWYRGRELQKNLIIEESTLTFVPSRTTTTIAATKHTQASTYSSTFSDVDVLNNTSNYSHMSTSSLSLTSESSTTSFTSSTGIPSFGPVVKEVLVARVILERPKATLALSGTYSCTNTCTQPLNLTLHVLIGDEETAAMQHINQAFSLDSRGNKTKMMLSVFIYFLTCT